jgi:hypothetical protein
MSKGLKYQASIVVLLILLFAHADGSILMPLCDVCATSNATNCLTCRTAKLFATIVTGINILTQESLNVLVDTT